MPSNAPKALGMLARHERGVTTIICGSADNIAGGSKGESALRALVKLAAMLTACRVGQPLLDRKDSVLCKPI
jgi:hypothetical protein